MSNPTDFNEQPAAPRAIEKVSDKIERLLQEINSDLDHGRIVKAHESMSLLNKLPTLSRENSLKIQFLKIRLLAFEEKFQEALNIANDTYSKALELGKYRVAIQIGVELVNILSRMGEIQSAESLLDDLEVLNESHFSSESVTMAQFTGDFLFLRTMIAWYKGALEDAIRDISGCIKIRENAGLEIPLANAITLGGMIYCELGEIPKGIKMLKDALLRQKKINNQHQLSIIYNNLGWVAKLQGDLGKAKKYLQESLKLRNLDVLYIKNRMELANLGVVEQQMGNYAEAEEHLFNALSMGKEVGNPVEMAVFLYYVVKLLLDQNKIAQAKHYLDELQKLSEQIDNKKIRQRFQLSYALYLKNNPRVKNLYRAQTMLREIAEHAVVKHELTVEALIHLCDLLIFELKISNDQEIVNEINEILAKLLDIAKEIRSYYLWSEINFLKAKLALMNLDLASARKLFNHAQIIAQEQGLQQLAMRISNEHDLLLEQEKMWEKLQQAPPDFSKRTELAQVNANIQRIKRQGIVENIKVEPEDPVMFIIMNQCGPTIYSYSFKPELNFDDQLFGGVLSAFESFSSEIFDGILERAKFGEYKVLFKTLPPFLLCYIYKGPSFFAQEKFLKALNCIQRQENIWSALNEAIAHGNLVASHRIPELNRELDKIFNSLYGN